MGVSLRDSLQQVSDPEKLDACVNEFCQMMLGMDCQRDEEPAHAEGEMVTSVVGFAGALSGACIFRASYSAAIKLAGLMIGEEFGEVDDTVKDAIGEICNIVAGGWKGKVQGLGANCGLSVPTVVTGRDYHLRVQSLKFRVDRSYRFEDCAFEASIVCHSLE